MPVPADERSVIEQYCLGFPQQNADGVDLSLIRENLKLTPTERLRRNYEVRRQVLQIQGSARRIR
jgi:hypothetical protein